MKIDRLRLLGFKSFVDPTELIISRGLTGVVGPNGCGKSNLLEALRWVMGETSYKSMRGSAMEDVIFSGTKTRPARNSAEVTIFLDNRERLAPAEYNEVDTIEITRRIERDAGSAYRINGKEARARDVKVLFEDAATGARSPALVRQGQISDIVNAKPEQRRRILEDAAGIAGLHTRRHEAELRLNAATTNLERLVDILGQLNSQVESLKRQARQAKRYKEISANIRTTEALYFHLSWTAARTQVDSANHQFSTATAALSKASKNESEKTRIEAKLAEALTPLRETEAKKAAALGRLNLQSENFEAEATRAHERLKELSGRLEQLKRDHVREESQLEEANTNVGRLEKELEKLKAEEESLEAEEKKAGDSLKGTSEELARLEEQLNQTTLKGAEARAQHTASENKISDNEAQIERLQRQLAALKKQTQEISARAPDAEKMAEMTKASGDLSSAIADIEKAAVKAENFATRLAGEREKHRQTSSEANLTARALNSERETLSKLLLPDTSSSAPPIVDQVSVKPGLEAALGAALGDDLEASNDKQQSIHWRVLTSDVDDRPLPEHVEPLSNFVTAPAELARRLAQIGLVRKEDGGRLQPLLSSGQRLVSREGDLWRWDGYVAASEGITPAAKRLAERNRLASLQQDVTRANLQANEAAGEFEKSAQAYTRAETEAKRTRHQWREAQSELAKLRDALSGIERQARETESQLAAVAGARTSSEQDLKEAQDKLQSAIEFHKNLPNLETFDEQLRTHRDATLKQRDIVADQRASLSGLQKDRQRRAERLKSAKDERVSWQSRSKNARIQLETLTEREQKAKTELAKLADLPEKIETQRKKLISEIAAAELAQKQAADSLAVREAEVKAARDGLRAQQNIVAEAREERARSEAKLESARERLDDEQRRIGETLNVKPEACLDMANRPEDETELPPLNDVEKQLAKLKADRERLGGVNLAADQDLETLAKEFDTLDVERADVEAAIEKLRNGISQLNREGRKRLKEAFESVNTHFGTLFTTLFGGGEARLEMIDGDDPLQGGLEIIARPPGKKPATLSLLSGGEQTLTALSLIFAVFLTNPSPICVLDEVDAPLDDANVDRFCKLMEKMSDDTETRFLVITHHPMTMTRMNRLFGVTMGERGVSQLVSVDLETAQGFREAG